MTRVLGAEPRALINRVTAAPYRVAAALGVAVAANAAFDPVHTHIPLCPFHSVTGWSCPLCGGLRSAYSLAQGHLTDALHDNLLFVATLPLLALYWLDWDRRSRRGLRRRPVPLWAVVVVSVLAVGFCIVRNLPFAASIRPL
jgi:hypothetical protein